VQFSNDTLKLNIIFNRLVHDWEAELVTSFFNLFVLYQVEMRW
jgi:hypothetical protein